MRGCASWSLAVASLLASAARKVVRSDTNNIPGAAAQHRMTSSDQAGSVLSEGPLPGSLSDSFSHLHVKTLSPSLSVDTQPGTTRRSSRSEPFFIGVAGNSYALTLDAIGVPSASNRKLNKGS